MIFHFQTSPDEEILDNGLKVVDRYITQGALATFLLEGLTIPDNGHVTAFYAYFVHNGTIQFQVWRPDQLRTISFNLVAKFDFTVSQAPGLFGVSILREDMPW